MKSSYADIPDIPEELPDEPVSLGIRLSVYQSLTGKFRTPEDMLMAAVLNAAIFDFKRYRESKSRRGRAAYEEVSDWFHSEDGSYLLSFGSICREFSIKPETIYHLLSLP